MNTAPQIATALLSSIAYGERFRKDFGDLEALKKSITEKGLIQPIAVKRVENSGMYHLLAGGRRWKALTELALASQTDPTIPIRVYDHDLTIEELRAIELEENIQRKDLNWMEEVTLKKELHELRLSIYGEKTSTSPNAPGWSQRDTAKLLGESAVNTGDDLKLAKYLEEIPELAQCESKSEAAKLIKKMTKTVVVEELANRALAHQASSPIEVLRKEIMNNYLIGDCIRGMQTVPDKSIDLIEIDPPYSIDLQGNKFCWNGAGDGSHDHLAQADYNEIEEENYPAFIRSVLTEAYRCLATDGWLLLWFGPDPWFEFMLRELRLAGFRVRGIPLLWVKTVGQTLQPQMYLGSAYEMCFYAQKGSPRINKQGRINVFTYPVVPGSARIHPTERPLELMDDVLNTFAMPGSRVMVPFAGSGNTILSAYNNGMSAFGWDLTEAYRNSYITRCANFTPAILKQSRKD